MLPVILATLAVAVLVVVPVFGSLAPEMKVATGAALIYPTMGLVAVLVADDLRRLVDSSTRPIWNPLYVDQGTLVFFGVSVALGLGTAVGGLVSRSQGRDPTAHMRGEVGAVNTPGLSRNALVVLLTVSGILLATQVIIRGPAELISRESYLEEEVDLLTAVIGQFAPLGAAAAAVVATSNSGPKNSGRLVFALYCIVAFASATRGLGLLALLWLGALFINGHRISALVIGRQMVLMFLGTSLALALRGLALHGLFPYTEAIITDFWGTLESGSDLFVAAALLGPPLAGTVVATKSVTGHDIATSLNPLPSSFTDWATIAPALRVYSFVPYNGIGELWSFSWLLAVGFFFVVGILMAITLRVLWRIEGRFSPVFRCLGLILAFNPLILLTEYNLRSGARFIWIEAAVVIAAFYLHRRSAGTKELVA